jgi:hypothetical protein
VERRDAPLMEMRIGLPIGAKVGATLAAIGGLIVVAWALWVILPYGDAGVSLLASDAFLLAFLFASGVMFIVVAVVALMRRYLAAGVLDIIVAANAIFFVYDVLELLLAVVMAIAGAILILFARERAQPSVLNVMRLYRRMPLAELAGKLSTTEATVELAVLELRSQGQPIDFVPETREVVYTGMDQPIGVPQMAR